MTRFPRPLRVAIRRWRRYGAWALQAARDCLRAKWPADRPRQRARWLRESSWAFSACARLVLLGRTEEERARESYSFDTEWESKAGERKSAGKRERRRLRHLAAVDSQAART